MQALLWLRSIWSVIALTLQRSGLRWRWPPLLSARVTAEIGPEKLTIHLWKRRETLPNWLLLTGPRNILWYLSRIYSFFDCWILFMAIEYALCFLWLSLPPPPTPLSPCYFHLVYSSQENKRIILLTRKEHIFLSQLSKSSSPSMLKIN